MARTVPGRAKGYSDSERENNPENGAFGVHIFGKFQKRKMLPGEAISLYLHELKMLLDQAMPVLAAEAKQQLLVHQFLAGLPVSVSRQLRATGDTKVLDLVVERAKLLMVVQEQTAATTSEETEVSKLRSQVSQLTEQVAVLNMQRKDGRGKTLLLLQPAWTYSAQLSKPTPRAKMLRMWKTRPHRKRMLAGKR